MSARDVRRSGMTLLEVIVALAVAGAALAAGASTLGFLTDQQDRSGAQVVASAYAVRSTMREWIGGAQLSTQGDAEFTGAPRGAQRENDDELTFVTSAPTQVGTTGTIVHLYIGHDLNDSLHGLMAEMRPWRKLGAVTRVQLASEATGLGIRYLASIDGDRKWQLRWPRNPVLPAAVQLHLRFDGVAASSTNDRAAQSLLAMAMTVPLGARR